MVRGKNLFANVGLKITILGILIFLFASFAGPALLIANLPWYVWAIAILLFILFLTRR